MADVQKQFDGFHEAIKLKRFDENQTLREKRDIIRKKINDRLPGIFEECGEECPTYYFQDQGSYEMGTGVKSLNGDEDIDQGLYFDVSSEQYPDPLVLKKRVHAALDGHTDSVKIRRPCVTVQYHREGEPIYHVDIAIYADGNSDGKSRLAVGRESTPKDERVWQVSIPKALTDLIFNKFKDNNRKQFRRIVRYLKRWKDVNFSSDGNAAPLGIALTVATYHYLLNKYTDSFAGKPDDLWALRSVVDALVSSFQRVWNEDEQRFMPILSLKLPVEPHNDLFEQMTAKQMEALEDKLKKLQTALKEASNDADPVDASTRLRSHFGSDFPVPEKEDTAKTSPKAIFTSGNSA